MYQDNPIQLIQMIKSGKNPQQLLISILEGPMSSTPLGKNLLTMAKNGDGQGIEQVARNLTKQQGIDFDTAFNAFKQQYGL